MAKITLPYFRDRFQYLFPRKYNAQQDFISKIDAELAFWDRLWEKFPHDIRDRRS